MGIVGCVNYDNSFENLTAAPWTWSRTDYSAPAYGSIGQIYSAGGIRATTTYIINSDNEKVKFGFGSLGTSDGLLEYSYCVDYLKDQSDAVKTAYGYDRCVACNDAAGGVIGMLSFSLCCAGIAILMFL